MAHSDTLTLHINDNGDEIDLAVFDRLDVYGEHAVDTLVFADGTSLSYTELLQRGFDISGSESDDMLIGTSGQDRITGLGGDDVIIAGPGSDTLYGEGDMDLLFGGSGDDFLDGGTDVDVLSGGTGNDTYIVDNIRDVVIENFREGTDTVLSSVSYSLGWNVENLTLTGSASINGTGNSSDNVLTGNSGANRLSGGYGSDTLDGGAGSDILEGGLGNDTYLFGRGSGQDRIVERDWTPGNSDKLVLGPGVASDQLWLRHVGYDLEMSIIGTQDKVTIADWYRGSAYRVEELKTSDGKTLLSSNVDALVSAMAAFAPPAAGQTSLPANYQDVLNPLIAANWR